MADRSELTSYEYRKARARVLAASDVCIVCGHGAADAVDHIVPVAKGGARLDPTTSHPSTACTAAPSACASATARRGDKPLAQVTQLITSVDWFAGPAGF